MTETGEKEQKKPLSAKRLRFTIEYPIDNNGAAAARRSGYSEKTAGSIASELLKIPEVQRAIERQRAGIGAKTAYTIKQVIDNLIFIQGRAIELDRLADANRATELLGKHLGAFVEKIEITDKSKPEMTPQQRAEHLRSQMRILDEQERAGTAIPGQEEDVA